MADVKLINASGATPTMDDEFVQAVAKYFFLAPGEFYLDISYGREETVIAVKHVGVFWGSREDRVRFP
jgi:hypothetical protein